MNKFLHLLLIITGLQLGGCAIWNPPSPMSEIEVHQKLVDIKPIEPEEKLYRQYVSDGIYIQFERMDENNVIYGWYTCTDCNWTRSKILAIYDGSYLYMAYGHHEEFFLESPTYVRQHPSNAHWSWSVIEKFQLEGRNLIKLGQIRKCADDTPQIQEWDNAPWALDGETDCKYKRAGKYNKIYVATIDETLTGIRSSIVGEDADAIPSDVRAKLAILKSLFDDGLINEQEYADKRKILLDDL
ncbi:SHOCT domain-containing protein [Alteromonas sp. C1M14]|uniref:SHOCT domain-containing protein n=1 Tax=Alteromonas sp. C1M14 TaxID=2841567 RepID=UPI001C08C977|nr:SHOCT domain-containing protein [Alteromonas sp. C1M14]MBU2977616.1 SHOCT domain-containing protein [Alteromonas sp. C1M14]